MLEANAARQNTTHDQVFRPFNDQEQLHAVAALNAAEEPVALIDRCQFLNRWAKPSFNDLYGR